MLARLLIQRSMFPTQRIVSKTYRKRLPFLINLSRPLVTQQRRMLATPPPHVNVRLEVYETGGLLFNNLRSQRLDHGAIPYIV
jgi:hypothetical protein